MAVVIATPGRLIDHLDRNSIDLSRIEVLVLDEADRMLDMGFLPDIRRILAKLPAERQTLLFSATMSPAIETLARSTLHQPQSSRSARADRRSDGCANRLPGRARLKDGVLLHLLESEGYQRVLVFTRTRRGAERLAPMLASREYEVNRIHADRTQPQREAALRGFRDGVIASSWRPISLRAASTLMRSRTSSTTMCPRPRKITSTASDEPGALATKAVPLHSSRPSKNSDASMSASRGSELSACSVGFWRFDCFNRGVGQTDHSFRPSSEQFEHPFVPTASGEQIEV